MLDWQGLLQIGTILAFIMGFAGIMFKISKWMNTIEVHIGKMGATVEGHTKSIDQLWESEGRLSKDMNATNIKIARMEGDH